MPWYRRLCIPFNRNEETIPANIFFIVGDEIDSYEEFNEAIENNEISNKLYMPDDFPLPGDSARFTGVTFREISFKKTTFKRVKFVNCKFIKCFFSYSHFTSCDFSKCIFRGCNFISSYWEKTRINPKTLRKNFDYKNDANIAVNLFQSLYKQFKNEHQRDYVRRARYLYKKAEYGLDHYEYKEKRLSLFTFGIKRIKATTTRAIGSI